MANIIPFPVLCRGEIVNITVDHISVKCQVIRHEGNDVYRLKALNGPYKGYIGNFKVTEISR